MPVWSSRQLEDTVDAIMRQPGAGVPDLYHAFWRLLDESGDPLTETMTNLIKDIVVWLFMRYRTQYEAAPFQWMVNGVAAGNSAQAYLAAFALPVKYVPQCRDLILKKLAGTEFEEKARQQSSE